MDFSKISQRQAQRKGDDEGVRTTDEAQCRHERNASPCLPCTASASPATRTNGFSFIR
jgi:hypothetical protein